MNYDYLIWGNWDPIYLAVAFLAIVLIYMVNKDKLTLENVTNNKFKIFVIGVIAFVLFYFSFYSPRVHLIRDLLLIPVNVVPNFSYTFNILPFANIILFIGASLVLFYGYRFLAKRFVGANIFKK